ncbi:MAG: AcrR family transcriptional regulator, partial [bacterium]
MNKGEETRMAILNSALSLAESLGLEGITIGKLAKEVGLSKSGLFAHFESKEGLQVQILQEISSRFTQDVVQPSLRMPRGIPRLQELFFRWIAELDYHEASGRCLIMHGTAEFDDRPGVVRDELVGLQQQLSRTILRILQTTVDEGHLHADL